MKGGEDTLGQNRDDGVVVAAVDAEETGQSGGHQGDEDLNDATRHDREDQQLVCDLDSG